MDAARPPSAGAGGRRRDRLCAVLALELIGVSKSFGAKRALRGVSLSLPEGSALGLGEL